MRPNRTQLPALKGLSCLLCAVSVTSTAQAQPSDSQLSDQSTEVIVTGERVPRSLRDTASSVDVTTAERIEALSGVDRIEQVLEQVPNVVLGSGGEGASIRGQDTTGVLRDLPSFLGGTRPRTTLQVDGRAVGFNELFFGAAGLWDVERIEVFRTPQTTTQGLNSIAGAIFIHSQDPSYVWGGRGRAVVGNYRTQQASVVVSGPILEDQLAFRAAADVRRGRPSSKIVDITRDADPNNDDYSLLRFKLLSQPRFWRGSRIKLTYAHIESKMPQVEGIRPPFRKRLDPIDRYGTFGTNVDSLTGVVEHPIAADLSASTTLAYGDADIRRFAFPGLGETKTQAKDFSVEVLLDWHPKGATRIVGGASYRRLSLDQFIDLSAFVGLGEFDDNQQSLGLFGEASLQPVARTTVTAGFRYQRDRQRRFGIIGVPTGGIPLEYNESFSEWLPKLSVAYDVTDEVSAGVLIQRAYNPGGTTIRFDTGAPENFGAETLWNYELFARGRFAGGALNLAANLFYTSMRDSQRFRSITTRLPDGTPVTFAEIFNVPRGRSYGAEVTAEWQASDRLSARAAIGLLNTKVTRTDFPGDLLLGSDFQRSPGLTASGSIDWRPIGPLRLSAQGRHHSSYFSDDRETDELRIGSATIFDARASWTGGRFTVFGYVRNLFDAFRLRYLLNPGFATAHDPRELGLGVETRF